MTKISDNKYLDSMHREFKTLTHISYALQDLGGALSIVGLNQLSDNMVLMAADIERSVKEMRGAVSIEINERLRQSQEATANMISGMLAVATSAKKA